MQSYTSPRSGGGGGGSGSSPFNIGQSRNQFKAKVDHLKHMMERRRESLSKSRSRGESQEGNNQDYNYHQVELSPEFDTSDGNAAGGGAQYYQLPPQQPNQYLAHQEHQHQLQAPHAISGGYSHTKSVSSGSFSPEPEIGPRFTYGGGTMAPEDFSAVTPKHGGPTPHRTSASGARSDGRNSESRGRSGRTPPPFNYPAQQQRKGYPSPQEDGNEQLQQPEQQQQYPPPLRHHHQPQQEQRRAPSVGGGGGTQYSFDRSETRSPSASRPSNGNYHQGVSPQATRPQQHHQVALASVTPQHAPLLAEGARTPPAGSRDFYAPGSNNRRAGQHNQLQADVQHQHHQQLQEQQHQSHSSFPRPSHSPPQPEWLRHQQGQPPHQHGCHPPQHHQGHSESYLEDQEEIQHNLNNNASTQQQQLQQHQPYFWTTKSTAFQPHEGSSPHVHFPMTPSPAQNNKQRQQQQQHGSGMYDQNYAQHHELAEEQDVLEEMEMQRYQQHTRAIQGQHHSKQPVGKSKPAAYPQKKSAAGGGAGAPPAAGSRSQEILDRERRRAQRRNEVQHRREMEKLLIQKPNWGKSLRGVREGPALNAVVRRGGSARSTSAASSSVRSSSATSLRSSSVRSSNAANGPNEESPYSQHRRSVSATKGGANNNATAVASNKKKTRVTGASQTSGVSPAYVESLLQTNRARAQTKAQQRHEQQEVERLALEQQERERLRSALHHRTTQDQNQSYEDEADNEHYAHRSATAAHLQAPPPSAVVRRSASRSKSSSPPRYSLKAPHSAASALKKKKLQQQQNLQQTRLHQEHQQRSQQEQEEATSSSVSPETQRPQHAAAHYKQHHHYTPAGVYGDSYQEEYPPPRRHQVQAMTPHQKHPHHDMSGMEMRGGVSPISPSLASRRSNVGGPPAKTQHVLSAAQVRQQAMRYATQQQQEEHGASTVSAHLDDSMRYLNPSPHRRSVSPSSIAAHHHQDSMSSALYDDQESVAALNTRGHKNNNTKQNQMISKEEALQQWDLNTQWIMKHNKNKSGNNQQQHPDTALLSKQAAQPRQVTLAPRAKPQRGDAQVAAADFSRNLIPSSPKPIVPSSTSADFTMPKPQQRRTTGLPASTAASQYLKNALEQDAHLYTNVSHTLTSGGRRGGGSSSSRAESASQPREDPYAMLMPSSTTASSATTAVSATTTPSTIAATVAQQGEEQGGDPNNTSEDYETIMRRIQNMRQEIY